MNQKAEISFVAQPAKTYKMQYECDFRKDQCLDGENTECPIVKITDQLKRSGRLKVVCVSSTPTKNSKYHLHPNLLCNKDPNMIFCNQFGVASYAFYNPTGEVYIGLKNLVIRRQKKASIEDMIENWNSNNNEKFDPFNVGFNYKNEDLQNLKLCCQAIFDDSDTSNTIVSDDIINGISSIVIEFWDENKQIKAQDGDIIKLFVRKLTNDQRDIYAKIFDDFGWYVEDLEPDHTHSDTGLVFHIPAYKNIYIVEPVTCYFQLYIKDRNYSSDIRTFKYIPSNDYSV